MARNRRLGADMCIMWWECAGLGLRERDSSGMWVTYCSWKSSMGGSKRMGLQFPLCKGGLEKTRERRHMNNTVQTTCAMASAHRQIQAQEGSVVVDKVLGYVFVRACKEVCEVCVRSWKRERARASDRRILQNQPGGWGCVCAFDNEEESFLDGINGSACNCLCTFVWAWLYRASITFHITFQPAEYKCWRHF